MKPSLNFTTRFWLFKFWLYPFILYVFGRSGVKLFDSRRFLKFIQVPKKSAYSSSFTSFYRKIISVNIFSCTSPPCELSIPHTFRHQTRPHKTFKSEEYLSTTKTKRVTAVYPNQKLLLFQRFRSGLKYWTRVFHTSRCLINSAFNFPVDRSFATGSTSSRSQVRISYELALIFPIRVRFHFK